MENNILKLNKFKIFNFDNKHFLYVIETSALFEIDENLKTFLELNKNEFNLDLYEGDKDVVKECFLKSRLTFQEDNNKDDIKSEILTNYSQNNESSMVILLSQSCNLRCNYCYADGGEYNNKGFTTKENIEKSINFFFKNTSKEDLNIVLFGGEPLLNFELFKFTVEYAKERAKHYNKNISFNTTINGTLLNDEIAKFIKDNKINITISIDGDEITHNKNRFDVNGKGTYHTIITNVDKYLGFKNVSARATLTKFNTKIDEIYDHLYNLGFRRIHISPSINLMDNNSYADLTNSYRVMLDNFEKALKGKDFKYCIKNSNIIATLDRINSGSIRKKFCGAINNMFAVDIEGNIYGCHRLVTSEKSSYGSIQNDINDETRKELFESFYQTEEHKSCLNCWCKSLCGGGCPSENEVATGSFFEPHTNTCNLFRERTKEVLKLYIKLTDEEKEILFPK